MIKFGLIFLLLLKFTEIIFIENIPGDLQVFFWNIFLLSQAVIMSLVLHMGLSYRHQKLKSLNFVFLILSCFTLFDFVVEWTAAVFNFYGEIRLTLGVILFMAVLPACSNIISKAFFIKDSPYVEGKSFLVYKKPKNWCGMLALLFKAPFGHCFLVTKKKSFVFKKGILVEQKYILQQDNLHLSIPLVNLGDVRKLLKTKWSLKTNCFSVFNQFKRDYV